VLKHSVVLPVELKVSEFPFYHKRCHLYRCANETEQRNFCISVCIFSDSDVRKKNYLVYDMLNGGFSGVLPGSQTLLLFPGNIDTLIIWPDDQFQNWERIHKL